MLSSILTREPIDPELSGSGTALVLSGGGSLGAYQVGVLKALAHGRSRSTELEPLDPSLIVGTSVGAYNAAFLAAQGEIPFHRAVDRLEIVWRRRIADQGRGNGVYRLRFDPRDVVRGLFDHPARASRRLEEDLVAASQGIAHAVQRVLHRRFAWPELMTGALDLRRLLSMTPLTETIRRTIDFRRLEASPRRLLISAMAVADPKSRLVTFDGRKPAWCDSGERIVRGAVALPGVFPPVAHEGTWLVDSAAEANTPIAPAVRAGCRRLHVVLPWAGTIDSAMIRAAGTLESLYLDQGGSWSSQVFMNLRDLSFANHLWRAVEVDPGRRDQRLSWLASHGLHLPQQGPVAVQLHAPRMTLGLQLWQLLDFSERRIAKLIAQGYRDTVEQPPFDPSREVSDFRLVSLFKALGYSSDWVG